MNAKWVEDAIAGLLLLAFGFVVAFTIMRCAS